VDETLVVAACKHKPSGSPTAFGLGSRSLTIESASGSRSVTMGSRSLTGAHQQRLRLTFADNIARTQTRASSPAESTSGSLPSSPADHKENLRILLANSMNNRKGCCLGTWMPSILYRTGPSLGIPEANFGAFRDSPTVSLRFSGALLGLASPRPRRDLDVRNYFSEEPDHGCYRRSHIALCPATDRRDGWITGGPSAPTRGGDNYP
jgi:hypothetical protein